MKAIHVILFISLSNLVLDSLNFTLPVVPTDTLLQKSIYKADSITLAFQTQADSLNAFYQNQFSKIDSTRNRLPFVDVGHNIRCCRSPDLQPFYN